MKELFSFALSNAEFCNPLLFKRVYRRCLVCHVACTSLYLLCPMEELAPDASCLLFEKLSFSIQAFSFTFGQLEFLRRHHRSKTRQQWFLQFAWRLRRCKIKACPRKSSLRFFPR